MTDIYMHIFGFLIVTFEWVICERILTVPGDFQRNQKGETSLIKRFIVVNAPE